MKKFMIECYKGEPPKTPEAAPSLSTPFGAASPIPLLFTNFLCSSVVHTHPADVEKVDGQQLGLDLLFLNINILLGDPDLPSTVGPIFNPVVFLHFSGFSFP